jgi:hypothetical protein
MAIDLFLRLGVPGLWHDGAGGDRYFSLKDQSRAVVPGAASFTGALVSSSNGLNCLATDVGTGTGTALSATTAAGPTQGITFNTGQLTNHFISPPLAADITISGTVSFALCGSESSMNANATLRAALYRLDAEGALTLIVSLASSTELGTSLGRLSFSGAPTSTDMKKGDRFVVIPMIDDAGTMASGFTVALQVDGANASTADSKLTLTENVTFITAEPSGTAYWLRDTAAPISPGSATEKMLSQTQGSGTAEAVYTSVTGPVTFPGQQWTASAGGTAVEWYTPELDAFTLGGVVMAEFTNNAQFVESTQSDLRTALTLEIAVVDADGTNPVIWARGYTSTKGVTNPKKWYVSGADLAVGQGKRLRFRVYADDALPSGNQVAGLNRTIRYDGTSTYASRLVFTQTITEASTNMTGTATLALGGSAVAASGTVTNPTITGSGSMALGGTAAAASGQEKIPGTASMGMGGTGVSGSAQEAIPGTAQLALGGTGVAASGTHTPPAVSGSGGVGLGGTGVAATGQAGAQPVTGSGALAGGGLAVAAAGQVRITGSGSMGLGGTGAAAAGEEKIQGSGAIAQAGIGATGSAQEKITGSAALASGGFAVAGSAEERIVGTAAMAIAAPSVSGAGQERIQGSGDTALGGTGVAATGSERIQGTATVALGGTGIFASAGIPPITASGGMSLAGLAFSGTGLSTPPPVSGSGDVGLAGTGIQGAGNSQGAPAGGDGAIGLGGIGLAGAGTVTLTGIAGSGDLALGGTTWSGAGTVQIPPITGTGTMALGAVAIVASGAHMDPGARGRLRGFAFAQPLLQGCLYARPSLAGCLWTRESLQGDVTALPSPTTLAGEPALSGTLTVEI